MQARLSIRTPIVVLALATLWSSSGAPQSLVNGSHGGAQEQFICRLPGTSDRRIGIYRPEGTQRCRVDYTRDGATRSLWSSGHDYKFCVGKALDIVRLLESVNFQCRPETRPADSQSEGNP